MSKSGGSDDESRTEAMELGDETNNQPKKDASGTITGNTPKNTLGHKELQSAITGADIYKNFTAVKKARKRLRSSEQLASQRADAPVPTSNRFNVLDNPIPGTSNQNTASTGNLPKEKPTPMYIRGLSYITSLGKQLDKFGIKDFDIKVLKKGQEAKLQLSSITDYRIVQSAFTKEGIPFFTFQLKSERAFRVALKGLHPDTPEDEISRELVKKGFIPRKVSNFVNRRGEKTGIFMIDLDRSQEGTGSHPIYQLNRLMHFVVSVEEPHKRKQPVRCYNCQEFGHTSGRCHLSAVCSICSGRHTTESCTKKREDQESRKCNNCGGNHTSSWKGCGVYQEFLERINPRQSRELRREKYNNNLRRNLMSIPHEFPQISRQEAPVVNRVPAQPTFADALRGLHPNPKPGESSRNNTPKPKALNNISPLGEVNNNDFMQLMILMQTNITMLQSTLAEMTKKQTAMEESVSALVKQVTLLLSKN